MQVVDSEVVRWLDKPSFLGNLLGMLDYKKHFESALNFDALYGP